MKNKIVLLAAVAFVSLPFNVLHASNEEESYARVVAASSVTTLKSCLRVGARNTPKKQVSFSSEILDAQEEKVLSQAYLQMRTVAAQSKREKDASLSPEILEAKKSLLKMKSITFKKENGTELSAEEKKFLLTYRGPGLSHYQNTRRMPRADLALETRSGPLQRSRKAVVPMAAIEEDPFDEEYCPLVPLRMSPSPCTPMPVLTEENERDDTFDLSTANDDSSCLDDQKSTSGEEGKKNFPKSI